MSGYQVVIEGIRQSGQAAGRVAAGLRGATCSATVPGGDAGIPGARSAGKLAEVKRVLEDRERHFETRLDTHGASMATAADRYGSQEAAAASDLSTAPQPTGGVKAV
jgi:hypothetical protein